MIGDQKHSTIAAIIPSYNSAAMLPEAIQSVRVQQWPNLEIIVVDDGSSDDTPDVLRRLSGNDLRVLRQENAGPAAARNTAIEASHADWIAFLDADDIWLPGKLEAQMDAAAANPDIGFCYADAVCRNKYGSEWINTVTRPGRPLLLELIWGPQFGMGTVIVRRQCLDAVGRFDSELRTGEDWDMWLRLAARYMGCHLSKAVAVHRVADLYKYPSVLMERCTLRVMKRLFADPEIATKWPQLIAQKKRVMAWHYSVLAKSHFRQNRLRAFCRMAFLSALSHPEGIYFLGRRWDVASHWPDIRTRFD